MKKVLGSISILLIAVAAYYFFTRASSEGQMKTLLQEATDAPLSLTLDSCDFLMTTEAKGTDGAPVALSRFVTRADLRNYNFKTVRFFPRSGAVTLRIDRKPATSLMLEQASDIFEVVGKEMPQQFPDRGGIRDALDNKDGSLFLRVMAEVKTTNGESTMIAHKDAPNFFAFAQSVEALPPPASYQSITTYAPGGPTAETLLTGKVTAVPALQFTLKTEDQAKQLAQAFYRQAAAFGCE